MIPDYVPPEQINNNSVMEQTILAVNETQANATYALKPTDGDLKKCASAIVQLFADGFQWSDVSTMMFISLDFLDKFFDLSIEEKRQALIVILDHVIDKTDTPLLPDKISDPIFKSLVPPFVRVIIPDNLNELIPIKSKMGRPAQMDINYFGQAIINTFSDGFQWSDLITVTRLSIRFASTYKQLTGQEKAEISKQLIDYVIDKTDTPNFPDNFSDPIFKTVTHSMIDSLFSAYHL